MDLLSGDVLSDLQDKFEKVRKLLDEESKTDPATDPYRSKYKAQGLLNEMKGALVNLLDRSDDTGKVKLHAMLGVVWYNAGLTSYETDELSTAEEQLSKCLDVLESFSVQPECIVTLICALNQLGILWSEREDTAKLNGFLSRAEQLYRDFVAQSGGRSALSAKELFGLSSEGGERELEKAFTHTLYFLAQYYNTQGQPLRSAVYVHNTLKRQLESKDYDPIDWALNAATLSQYFATNNGFEESRHHLAAASVVLDQYEEQLREKPEGSEEERDAKKETLRHRSADVARCWAKYGINLLALSQARLVRLASSMDDTEETPTGTLEDGGVTLKSLAPEAGLEPDALENLRFPSLELGAYESSVSAKPASLFDEARELFLDAKQWLTRAQEYYTMESHASDAVQIAQDLSRIYKHLTFFEDNEERQSRMHKRRVDVLEAALAQLNPQYYLAPCQQLWFELAEIYSEIVEIKKQKLRTMDVPNPNSLSKINNMARSGIAHLNSFLKSLHVKGTQSLPSELGEELVRPVLLAFFYLGKLHRDLIMPDKAVQASNLEASIDAYKYIVSYCEKHEEARKQAGAELGISKEMVTLLPIKLARLREQQAVSINAG